MAEVILEGAEVDEEDGAEAEVAEVNPMANLALQDVLTILVLKKCKMHALT